MKEDLSGRVALVTGASKGIGRAVAVELAECGCDLLVAARSADALDDLKTKLEQSTGRRIVAHPADLTQPDAPAAAVEAAIKAFGKLDILVNNAGSTKRGDFKELTEEDWRDGFALKFFGYVRATRAAWPHLGKAKGCIVNVIGVGAWTPEPEFTIGGSVNAGLLNFTKAMAARGVVEGIRVNAVNPGPILTDRLTVRIRTLVADEGIDEQQATERLVKAQRIARFGRPEEIAGLVAFLASERAGFMNGALVDMDGGATKGL